MAITSIILTKRVGTSDEEVRCGITRRPSYQFTIVNINNSSISLGRDTTSKWTILETNQKFEAGKNRKGNVNKNNRTSKILQQRKNTCKINKNFISSNENNRRIHKNDHIL